MLRPSYEELLARIVQLEKENRELRIRCGMAPPMQPPKPLGLSPEEKIELFRGLFRGRDDVFARRWHSKASGKSGYQPVCANEWVSALCDKKKHKCAECPNRKFEPLSSKCRRPCAQCPDNSGCEVGHIVGPHAYHYHHIAEPCGKIG
jgi:hypothetical protein